LLFVTPTGVRVKQKDGKELSFVDSNGECNLTRLKQALDKTPSITEMREMSDRFVLRETLDKRDPLLHPLLRWIITSNRAHIRKLAPEEEMKNMGTKFQFVLLSSTPEKEQKFLALRRRAEVSGGTGSLWAFHGSSTGNWHSILRTGLKNMSNTKYMTTGAALGPGIYMATNSSTSLAYCREAGGWGRSMFGNFLCLALCELVNQANKNHNRGGVYVVPDEDLVVTRFFFILDSSANNRALNVDVSNLNVPKLA